MQFWAESKREEGVLTWIAAGAVCADGSTAVAGIHKVTWAAPVTNRIQSNWRMVYMFLPLYLFFWFPTSGKTHQSVLNKWVYIFHSLLLSMDEISRSHCPGLSPVVPVGREGGTWLMWWEHTDFGMSVGQHMQRAVSQFGTSSNPSQIIFVLQQCEAFLYLPLIRLDCVVPISLNRYGWNPMSSGIDRFHLYPYFRWNAAYLDFCHACLFFSSITFSTVCCWVGQTHPSDLKDSVKDLIVQISMG